MKEYRNPLKELFIKYTLHKCIRLNSLNNLLDEINEYYIKNIQKQKNENKITVDKSEFHEQHLKDQLNGWINYLEIQKLKLNSDSEHNQGIIEGFCMVIQLLKVTSER